MKLKQNRPNTSLVFVFIAFQLFANTLAIYTFITKPNHASVANIPYHKRKAGINKDITEDFGLANQFCLVVCDGVGGSKFNSQYSAKYVSTAVLNKITSQQIKSIQETHNTMNYQAPIKTHIALTIYDSFVLYNQAIDNAYNAYIQYLDENSETEGFIQKKANIEKANNYARQSVMAASTTLVTLSLTEKDGEPYVNITQMGDSLATIFIPSELEDITVYAPILITKDMQYKFNSPLQLNTMETEIAVTMANQSKADKSFLEEFRAISYNRYFADNAFTAQIPVPENAVLLLASDGLYDNVSTSFVTIIVNYILKYLEDFKKGKFGEDALLQPKDIVDDLVDEYIALHQKTDQELMVEFQNIMNFISAKNLIIKETNYKYQKIYPSMYQKYVNYKVKQAQKAANNAQTVVDEDELNRTLGDIKYEVESILYENEADQRQNQEPAAKIEIDNSDNLDNAVVKKRILMSNLLTTHQCSVADLQYPNLPSESYKSFDSFTLSSCLAEILKTLQVETNYLPEYGPNIVAEALAYTAKKIMLSGIRVSPFGVKYLQYKQQICAKIKNDDITVVVSMIQNKEENEVLEEFTPEFRLDTVSDELTQEAIEFLKNLKIG